MILIRSFFSIIAISMLPCPLVFAQSLEGKWLGQISSEKVAGCWTNYRKSDGTYQIDFLFVTPFETKAHNEEGTWFLSNGFYATLTERINGDATDSSDRRFREVYKVVELTNEKFVYADIDQQRKFTVTRVPETFSLGLKCPER